VKRRKRTLWASKPIWTPTSSSHRAPISVVNHIADEDLIDSGASKKRE
jgi:hypothetical protein